MPLPLLPKARPVARNTYLITARQGLHQFHPAFGRSRVFGYDDNSGRGVASPGYTLEMRRGTPTKVNYVNALPARHLFDSVVPDYMHAGTPVRMNTHLHGGHVAARATATRTRSRPSTRRARSIRARWTLPEGVATPQRYVFHCHILEHEDNSMMRPLEIVA